jgi:putative transposase
VSRLRRLVLSDRFFFVSCRLAVKRQLLANPDFGCLARVVRERRAKYRFLLTSGVFLPDHWHAIIYPRYPLTISTAMEAIKVGTTLRINARRKQSGRLWQSRYFDRALRTVKEYHETVEYIHLNPVKAGLVRRPEEWPWSSIHDYKDTVKQAPSIPTGLTINRLLLPADERARI